MAQPIWNSSTKHYSFAEKVDPKDRIEVEIGDAEDSKKFHPQFKIKRWDNEVNASFRLLYGNIPGNISYSDDGTTVTWSKGQWEAKFYSLNEGFEFEIHIPSRPPINYLEFSVNDKELDWFYQPELIQQEIDGGASRPDNVIGSYAVYHKTKGGMNDSAGMEYRAGKAFHVYRPHVVDSAGSETWGELNLNAGVLTISVDQAWLDTAVYPVIIDPTFGNLNEGGSNQVIAQQAGNNTLFAGSVFTPTESGTIDTITGNFIMIGDDSETVDTSVMLYIEDVIGNTHDRVAVVERTNMIITSTRGWFEFTAGSEAFTAVDHILGATGDGRDIPGSNDNMAISYDAAGGHGEYYTRTYGGNGYDAARDADPLDDTPTTDDRQHSIYVTYTATNGAAVAKSLSLMGIGK